MIDAIAAAQSDTDGPSSLFRQLNETQERLAGLIKMSMRTIDEKAVETRRQIQTLRTLADQAQDQPEQLIPASLPKHVRDDAMAVLMYARDAMAV